LEPKNRALATRNWARFNDFHRQELNAPFTPGEIILTMSEASVSDRMMGTATCASKRPAFLSLLGAVAEVEVKVESMRQDKRSIVRRRTQQLVYLELGRENGGVMLNLSQEGCGFQAITPVKCGETRFGFQINGGRRIAGDAEIVWADESGVMGGLRFINLPVEAHKEIQSWLEETNAPMEYGYASAAVASAAAAAGASYGAVRQSRSNGSEERGPLPRATGSVRLAEPEVAPVPPWVSNQQTAGFPALEDPRYAAPFQQPVMPYPDPHKRSAAVWRGIAVSATVIALVALGIVYQKDVGNSLIWIGETMSGKTKASTVVPEKQPNPNASAPAAATEVPASSDAADHGMSGTPADTSGPNAVPSSGDQTAGRLSTAGRASAPAVTPGSAAGSDRSESVLERQGAAAAKSEPTWNEGDSIDTLWGAVQGGSVSAEVSLAERFARGEGVNKNCDQAKVLMKAAADRGNREARLRLYEMETGGCR
jgi:hypothetical protein